MEEMLVLIKGLVPRTTSASYVWDATSSVARNL